MMTLPCPIAPLARHTRFGQNCSDGFIGSVLAFICTSCRGPSTFSSLFLSFTSSMAVLIKIWYSSLLRGGRHLSRGPGRLVPELYSLFHSCYNHENSQPFRDQVGYSPKEAGVQHGHRYSHIRRATREWTLEIYRGNDKKYVL